MIDELDNKTRSEVLSYLKYIWILVLTISILFYGALYGILLKFFDLLINFFDLFEKASALQDFFVNTIKTPNITEVSIIAVILFAYFYIMQTIREKGYMSYEGEEIEEKYYKSLSAFWFFFNFSILLPLIIYLIVKGNRIPEIFTIVGLFILGALIVRTVFVYYVNILNDYEKLTSLNQLIQSNPSVFKNNKEWKLVFGIKRRDEISKSIMGLQFLSLFISIHWNFNLFSIVYIQLTLIFWYFVFCSVTVFPKGTVRIFLNNNLILEDLFIIEESRKGYIFVVKKDDPLKKKIITNSILYIEEMKRG